MFESTLVAQRQTTFDAYGETYDEALERGISATGEDRAYYARGRIAWLARCLRRLGFRPRAVLDYGCGTGSATPFFLELLGAERLVGVDVSARCLERAREAHGSDRCRFLSVDAHDPSSRVDLTFSNGVFHHIRPADRPAAVAYIFQSLRPGGLFAFWENNPWNPGTAYVMSRIPFDESAITLVPSEGKQLLIAGGFEVVRTDFLFIFPRALRWVRIVEPFATWLPLGAQYQILCRKRRRPSSASGHGTRS